MKRILNLCLLCMALMWGGGQPAKAQVSFGQAEKFNNDWRFTLEDATEATNPTFDDSKWRKLDLPHDWSIEGQMSPTLASCTGYLPGGIGWYRKTFEVTETNKRHYIYFEGVYNRSEVYLNGQLLGKRPNGYISFMYDMTPHLKQGKNVLAVRVDHSRYADSRWYTGSGIYRDVWMVKAGDIHFAQWGVGWQATKITNSRATVQVDMEVVNDGPSPTPSQGRDINSPANKTMSVRATIYDAEGKQVAKASSRTIQVNSLTQNAKHTLNLNISKPKRWTLKTPYLYTLKTEVLVDGKTVDSSTCRVGLRTLQFDANKGFALNGEWMKVKGVCLHHDAGVLGSVVPRDVWERRLRNLKEMGANAIRMSHNPQAPDVYDLCDELGLMVMDEASDEWEFPKRKWVQGWNVGTPSFDGTFDFFEEWIEQDVTDMVRRDRNHPSIILWSIGNEVDYPNDPYSHPVLDGTTINQPMFGGYKPDAPDAMRIGEIAKRLTARVKEVDTSRPVTGALAGVVMSNQTAYPGAVDVVGYNYTENRYDEDHKTYPDRIIYGSETHSSYEAWKAVRDREHIFGQFIWTGTDYLGESGRWPSRGLHTGLLDFGSFKKPRGWFRASLWSEKPLTYIGTYPMRRQGNNRRGANLSIDAPDLWNYRNGQTIRVVCYTNSPQARLLLNGEVVGEMKPMDDATGMIHWDIPYKAGKLTAEGCNQDGNVESTYTIQTSGRPYALKVRIDEPHLLEECKSAGDRSKDNSAAKHSSALLSEASLLHSSTPNRVLHFLIEVVDENGILVKQADNMITCMVQGPGRLLGLENSDNTDMTNHRDQRQRVYQGRLLAYVQSTGEEGTIRIHCSSPLLEGATAEVEVTLPREKGTIAPGKLWPDNNGEHINAHGGGVLYHNGTYYWYGEHKSENTSKALVGVTCYSSKNLTDWQNEGPVLRVSDDPESDITAGCVIERPKVIYNKQTGKFVMWFHLELKNRGYEAARAAVAVSDSPTGPFRFIRSGRVNPGIQPSNMTEEEKTAMQALDMADYKEWWTPAWYKAIDKGLFVKRDLEGGQMSRDMTLYVDDDGKAYHIYSSEDNMTLHIAELTDDYLSHTGKYVRLAPAGHNEAPAIFKRNGKYWMITSGCTGWDPNEARMFSADNIYGPWTKHPNPCVGPKANLTFGGQSTYILPVQGKQDAFIFMADMWRPQRHIDGRYIWLPIQYRADGTPFIEWMEAWKPSEFFK